MPCSLVPPIPHSASGLDSLLAYYINGLLSVCSRRGGTFIWFTHQSLLHTLCTASFAKSTLLQKLEMRTWGLEAGHLEGVSFERVSSGSLWLGLLICRGSCEHLPHRVVARMK